MSAWQNAVRGPVQRLLHIADTALGIEARGGSLHFVKIRLGSRGPLLLEHGEVKAGSKEKLPEADLTALILPPEGMMTKWLEVPAIADEEIPAYLEAERSTLFPIVQNSETTALAWRVLSRSEETVKLAVILFRPEQVEGYLRTSGASESCRVLHWLLGLEHLALVFPAPMQVQRSCDGRSGALQLQTGRPFEMQLHSGTANDADAIRIEPVQQTIAEEAQAFADLEEAYLPALAAALSVFGEKNNPDLMPQSMRSQSEDTFYHHLTKKLVLVAGFLVLIAAAGLYALQFALLAVHDHLQEELLAVRPLVQEVAGLKQERQAEGERLERMQILLREGSSLAPHLAALARLAPSELWFTNFSALRSEAGGMQIELEALARDPAVITVFMQQAEALPGVSGLSLQDMHLQSAKEIRRRWAVQEPQSMNIKLRYTHAASLEAD